MLERALPLARPRPPDTAERPEKKAYGERLSRVLAQHIAADLRDHGLVGCLPDPNGGAEREFAGGIGAKKVDVSWSSPEAGLLLALSIKTINYVDARSGNYQKNLTNRRGDMLFEAVTLHRRFPFAVLGGLLFLHRGAASDGEGRQRDSTLMNAHDRFRIFSGRADPGGREEQYEQIYLALYDDEPPSVELYEAGRPDAAVSWDAARNTILRLVADRNPDHFAFMEGRVIRR